MVPAILVSHAAILTVIHAHRLTFVQDAPPDSPSSLPWEQQLPPAFNATFLDVPHAPSLISVIIVRMERSIQSLGSVSCHALSRSAPRALPPLYAAHVTPVTLSSTDHASAATSTVVPNAAR